MHEEEASSHTVPEPQASGLDQHEKLQEPSSMFASGL
jgi:hypothetical protein